LAGNGTRNPNLFYPDSAKPGIVNVRYLYVDVNGCQDTAHAHTLVKESPTILATPDSSGICEGSATNITLSSPQAGVAYAYSASVAGSVSGAGNGSGSDITQTLTGAGTVTYQATGTLNGCTSTPVQAKVTVTARQIAIATPQEQTICNGSTGQIVFTGGAAGTTYTSVALSTPAGVSAPAGGLGDTLQGLFTNTNNSPATVQYQITPTLNGCAGVPVLATVTVQPVATVSVVTADRRKKTTNMALSWYQCKNCGTSVKKDSQPNSSGCSKQSSHSWTKLGEVGDTNYSCKKCGTTVQTKSSPNSSGCPESSSHSWTKL
jgi:predicted Zn-ribbon and HTH transcriptional regulator